MQIVLGKLLAQNELELAHEDPLERGRSSGIETVFMLHVPKKFSQRVRKSGA